MEESTKKGLRVIWVVYIICCIVFTSGILVVMNVKAAPQPNSRSSTSAQLFEQQLIDEAVMQEQFRNLKDRVDHLEAMHLETRLQYLEFIVETHNKVAEVLGVPFLFLLVKELIAFIKRKMSISAS